MPVVKRRGDKKPARIIARGFVAIPLNRARQQIGEGVFGRTQERAANRCLHRYPAAAGVGFVSVHRNMRVLEAAELRRDLPAAERGRGMDAEE